MPIKKIVLVFQVLILLMVLSSYKQKNQSPTVTWLYGKEQLEKLNGRVKQVITEQHNKVIKIIEYSNFDPAGNLTNVKESMTLLNVSPSFQKRYREIEKEANLKNQLYRFTNKFDSQGRKIEAVGFGVNSEERGDTSVYKFDQNGHLTTSVLASSGFLKGEIYLYTYDNLGKLATQTDSLGKNFSQFYRYKYNKNGYWIERLVYMDGKLDEVEHRKYVTFDYKRNWTKVIEKGKTITRKITYY